MLNLKKFTLGFSCACLLAFSSSLCFASGSPKIVVPATNLPEATINTTIDMSRSIDSQILLLFLLLIFLTKQSTQKLI